MDQRQFELHAEMELKHWWFLGRRKIVRELIHRALPPSPKALVVDVGCGTGANIAALEGEYDCLGVEPSADAVRLARARFPSVRFESRLPAGAKPRLVLL